MAAATERPARHRLNNPGEQIRPAPDVPNLYQVRRAARQDEAAKHPENPVEGRVAPFPDEGNQDNRNAVIR
jgi:hypothetical protein